MGVGLIALVVTAAAAAAATGLAPADEAAIHKVLEDYERAIETKDVELFRAVKPNLTAEEERKLRNAFLSIGSQDVKITVQSIRADGEGVAVAIHRRDDIDHGRLIAAFPQTIVLVRNKDRWVIQDIKK